VGGSHKAGVSTAACISLLAPFLVWTLLLLPSASEVAELFVSRKRDSESVRLITCPFGHIGPP
jgi:hypothetical protein